MAVYEIIICVVIFCVCLAFGWWIGVSKMKRKGKKKEDNKNE